jgi:phage gp37-like protein
MALCSSLVMLYVHLVYMQTVEEIQSHCRCSKDQVIQEMRVLNGRLVELEKMLAAERNNVVHLHKNSSLLSTQIRATKVSTQPFSLNRMFFS